MKHTYKALIAACAVTVGLLTPAAAFAAPITPDGSIPYSTDAYCYYPGTDFQVGTATPDDTQCQSIPSKAWQNAAIPTATPGAFTNVNIGQMRWVGSVVAAGTIQGTEDPSATTYEKGFFVQPSNPTDLPLLISTDLSIFGHNPELVTINSVNAYAVVDDIATVEDPIVGTSGAEPTQTVPAGSTFPVTLTSTGEGVYAADVVLPTSTFQRTTDGVLNGYGWSFGLTTIVEMTVDGNPETFVYTQHFLADSGDMADITHFSPDVVVPDGQIGVAGGGYIISLRSVTVTEEEPPVTTPPVVQPPVVTPPAPQPPVVDTPPTTAPPTEPQHPRVNTGDVNSAPLWGVGVASLLAAAAGAFLLRGRTRNVEG